MLSEHLTDEPLRVRLARNRYWEPKNYDGSYDGEVTVRDALVHSKNVPTVRLAEEVGRHLDLAALGVPRLGLCT